MGRCKQRLPESLSRHGEFEVLGTWQDLLGSGVACSLKSVAPLGQNSPTFPALRTNGVGWGERGWFRANGVHVCLPLAHTEHACMHLPAACGKGDAHASLLATTGGLVLNSSRPGGGPWVVGTCFLAPANIIQRFAHTKTFCILVLSLPATLQRASRNGKRMVSALSPLQ